MIRDNDGSGPLTKRYMETGTWEVDIAGKRFSVVASLQPLYDPTNTKIKA
jgi:4-methylaminobutanoate oxidase (formaldehyde-forming)